uniref:Conserved oligomeric Golgi complex subunit 8 n=1 Tax=Globodera pallida TaxID=36090 RepID=A0A183CL74_GLOPA
MTLNIEERIAVEKEFTSLSFGELSSIERIGFSQLPHLRGRRPNSGALQRDGIKQARGDSEKISEEYKLLNEVESTNNFIWQVLKLPKLMERYIRTGRYEQAYSLTNFAISLKQSKFTQTNAMLKNVVEVLIEARHNLLDELFSKFAAPIDLARSIQSEPDFLFRIIDIYRECMYDTIVLYLAVFPDCEAQRKFSSSNEDPRWESFLRRSEVKNCLDIEVMHSKLMSFAFSFGRMGLDFRTLIVHEFSQMVQEMFRRKMETATNCLTALQRLDLIDGDIFENTRQDIEDSGNSAIDLGILSAPLELCIWDDICVFGNLIIDVLNDLRHSLSIVLYFVPFINRCLLHCFPYELCGQFFRSSHCSVEEYREAFKLQSKELFVLCKHESVFNEILVDVQVNENAASSEWQNANEEERDNSDGWERLKKEGEVATEKSIASEPTTLVGEMEIEGEAEERSAEDQIDI